MCVCVFFINIFFFFSERDTLRTDLDLDNPPHHPRPFFLKTCTSIINHLHDVPPLQRHQQEEHQLRTGKGKLFCYTFKTAIETPLNNIFACLTACFFFKRSECLIFASVIINIA